MSEVPSNEKFGESFGMPPKPEPVRRSYGGLAAGLILILLGVVFLLSTMGYMTINWAAMVNFWPLLLVLLGLDIMIGRRSALGSAVMASLTVLVVGGVIWLVGIRGLPLPYLSTGGTPVTGDLSCGLGNAESLTVELDLDIMALQLSGSSDDRYAAQGTYTTFTDMVPEMTCNTQPNAGFLEIFQPQRNILAGSRGPFSAFPNTKHELTMTLTDTVPIDLVVETDLGAVDLDLSTLNLRSLDINADIGSVRVTLPAGGDLDKVTIYSDLGSVDVYLPPNVTVLNIDTLSVESNLGRVSAVLPAAGELGDVRIVSDLGSVNLNVRPVGGPHDLTVASLTVESDNGSVSVDLPPSGDFGDIEILSDLGAVTLDIPVGPEALSVTSLVVQSQNGSVVVTLPNLGRFDVNIASDLGSVTVNIPADLEAHIEIDPGLSTPNVSGARFQQIDRDTWQTSGYDGASNRANITIESETGSVTVAG